MAEMWLRLTGQRSATYQDEPIRTSVNRPVVCVRFNPNQLANFFFIDMES
jgi:hypothetical protein